MEAIKKIWETINEHKLITMRLCLPKFYDGKIFTRKIWNGDLISSDGTCVLTKRKKDKKVQPLDEYLVKNRVMAYKPSKLSSLNEALSELDMFAVAEYDSCYTGTLYTPLGYEISEREYFPTLMVYCGAKEHVKKVEECLKHLDEHKTEVNAVVKSCNCKPLVLDLAKFLNLSILETMKDCKWNLAWIDAIYNRTGELTEKEFGFRFVSL